MSQEGQPGQPDSPLPSKPSKPGRSLKSPLSIGLILVAILSVAFAGYTVLNPHTSTVTQQQLLTNTQSVFNTQTQTVNNVATQTVTSVQTVTSSRTTAQSLPPYGTYPYYNYPNTNWPYYTCGYYGCTYLNYFSHNVCQGTAGNTTVTCSGFLYDQGNGCIDLAIPIDNGYYFENRVYQFYSLQNLPSSHPGIGSWVTVTGQIHQGSNSSPSGAGCPGNYITVTSIS